MVKIDLSALTPSVSCIRLLKPVLDDAYQRIKGSDDEKDKLIARALDDLSNSYSDIAANPDRNYSPAVTRFAYILCYVPAHANLVVTLINRSKTLQKLMTKDEVEVASIGGGPGSEILGIMKYLKESGSEADIHCNVYDKETGWANSWNRIHSKVQKKLGLDVSVFPMFKSLDVTQKNSWANEEALLDADLITMVYFLSEVYKHKRKAAPFFDWLFANAKTGALFLYVDNSTGGCREWFDELAEAHNVKCFAGEEREVIQLGFDEEKAEFEIYYKKFERLKLKSIVSWRLCRKM